LPIFNANGSVDNTPSVSQDCADWVTLRLNSITTLAQDIVEGTVTGPIAEMPAGSLKFALGADVRREDLAFQPDSGFNANQDFPNVVGNIILPVSVEGSTSVKEIYGELAIPLLKDKPLVRSLEIDPGLRYSSYDTVGTVDTYKLTADWTVNARVRVRGGYQFANRAPNVAELFTPRGGSAIGPGTDACAYYPLDTPTWGNNPENPNRFNVQTLCQQLMVRGGAPPSLYVPGTASADTYAYNNSGATFHFPLVIGRTAGNPNLNSESADTTTLGIVLRPASRLTLSVDWFDIKLEGSIGTPDHDTVYNQCLDAKNNPLIAAPPGSHTGAELAAGNPYCKLIHRQYATGPPLTPGNFGADGVYDADYINQGGTHVEGYDVQVDWGVGNFTVNVIGSFVDTAAVSPVPGAAFFNYAGNVVIDKRTLSTVGYDRGRFSVGLRWLYLGERTPSSLLPPTALGVDAHNQFDVFASWRIRDRVTLRGGIDNATNADPEWVGVTTTNHSLGNTTSEYDQIGRRYFVGVTVSW
jgi:outer membrane receptor protein involved in Fe transport